MNVEPSKKMLSISILNILKCYSDVNHRLSQKEIIDLLDKDYGMAVERKAVKRNLMNLVDFGYDIEYTEKIRINKQTGEEETIAVDWYLEREFSDAELRLLIDGLLFSKHMPQSQCKELINKLKGLSNKYFQAKVKHICNMPVDAPENKQLFYNVEILDEAIDKRQQVEFSYNDFGIDKKLHLRLDSGGKVRRYLVNPYQMVATNGWYYLVCNYDKYDEVSNYRIDRISDIKLLDRPRKPMQQVQGLEHGLNLPKHMAEHIYMFSGESAPIELRIKRYIVGEIVDWFGQQVRFYDGTEDEITACVTVNLQAARCWALQYAPHLKVLSPQSLVDQMKSDIQTIVKTYKN